MALAATLVVSVASGAAGGWMAARSRAPAQPASAPATAQVPPVPVSGGLPHDTASIAALVRAVEPGVAAIHVKMPQGEAAGSGFVIDSAGHIATNRHVVSGIREATVDVGAARGLAAKVIGEDPEIDVAVLKVEQAEALRPIPLGDSDALVVGEAVVAVGNALNLPGGPTVTTGIVSAKDRTIEGQDETGGQARLTGLIQTDAAINPGNSGGPLLNLAGHVVGMNTAAAANPRDPTGSQAAQNIGFAQNVNQVRAAAEAIVAGRSAARLGVTTTTVTPAVAARIGLAQAGGALVLEVAPAGAAQKAGVRDSDVIVSAGGTAINSSEDLRSAIKALRSGDRLAMVILRDGKRIEIDAVLGT